MKKTHNKDGPEPDVSFVDSMHFPTGSAAEPRKDTGRKPRDETAGQPGNGTGRKPRDETAGKPRDGTGRKPRDETSGKPRDGTGRKPRDETAGRPRDGTGRKPRDETAGRSRDGTVRRFHDDKTGKPRDGNCRVPRDAILKPENRFKTFGLSRVTKPPGKPQIRGKTFLRRLKILGVNYPSGVVMAKLCPEVNDTKITEKEKLKTLVTRMNHRKTANKRMKSIFRNT